MKNKLAYLLVFLCFCIFGNIMQANAYVSSEYDIQQKVQQVRALSKFDFLSLVNKNELIGFRLDNFKMTSQYYSNNVALSADNLSNILNQINLVKNSSDYSDTEKNMQLNKLYQDANNALYDIDTKTISYLIEVRRGMPSITYQRYLKKFQDYYNSLGLTESTIILN